MHHYIKRAKTSDLDTLYDIVKSCSDSLKARGMHHWEQLTEEVLLDRISNNNVFILYLDEAPTGTITISENPFDFYLEKDLEYFADKNSESAYFSMLGVVAQHQRKSLGSVMINFAEEWAKERNIKYLRMTTRSSNKQLSLMYSKKNFEIIQERFVEELGIKVYFWEKPVL